MGDREGDSEGNGSLDGLERGADGLAEYLSTGCDHQQERTLYVHRETESHTHTHTHTHTHLVVDGHGGVLDLPRVQCEVEAGADEVHSHVVDLHKVVSHQHQL